MSGIHNQAKIDDMRRRLYARGTPPPEREHTILTDEPQAVAEEWQAPPEPKSEAAVAVTPRARKASPTRRKFRKLVLALGGLFFFGAVVISSVIMLWGNNGISAENISVSLNGPFTIGGGETMTIQVGVTNANTVPISAATLIIEYPDGTQVADGSGDTLFIERVPLSDIGAGETVNVPLQAVIFGEENSEQEITAAIEYRVSGSNATFFKDAPSLRYKISSAPVVVQVAANQRISSGQETDITITVRSNSPSPVSDVLVVAEYPDAFDFSSAEPQPTRGQDTWRIDTLEPAEAVQITTRGIIIGQETDELAIHFSVGVPREDDPTTLASVFNTATTEFIIEQPFIDIALELDSSGKSDVVVNPDTPVSGRVSITNTLEDIVYDTIVSLTLGGNALADPAVAQTDGFYDSRANIITWDQASRSSLTEIQPGETALLSFSLTPDPNVTRTPVVTLSADVESRRVRENRVPEVLTGSAEGSIQVAALPNLLSEARRTSGPIPPRAEQVTQYTISFLAESTSNSLNDVTVTATLPPYVTFGGDTSNTGVVTHNPTNRTITWTVDTIDAGRSAVGSFTLALEPSVSQLGTIPVLVEDQRLRATDAFTGTVVRASRQEVTTELSTELGFEPGNGRVTE